jgi:hypothetical protein
MPGACRVCSHPERQAIDAEILSGVPHRAIGATWGMGHWSVGHHTRDHLGLRPGRGAYKRAPGSVDLKERPGDLRAPQLVPPAHERSDKCSTCIHPSVDTIDGLIAAGVPYAKIGERFGMPSSTIGNHGLAHLGIARGARIQRITCPACLHPEADAINDRLRAGEATHAISTAYGVANSSLHRHRYRHLDNTAWEAKRTAFAATRLKALMEVAS